MKHLIALIALLTLNFLLGCSRDTPQSSASEQDESIPQSESQSPLDVVNYRMSAYNRHDLPSFMAVYSEDIEVFTYPNKSLGKGKKHLRSIFEPMLQEGVVQVDIHHQIVKDSFVVNHETVSYGGTTTEYISIYEVRDGLIKTVRFVRD